MTPPPVEWSCRGNRRRDLAFNLLRVAREHWRRKTEPLLGDEFWASLRRHAPAAATGSGVAQLLAKKETLAAKLRVAKAYLLSPNPVLDAALAEMRAAEVHGQLVRPSPDPIPSEAARAPGVVWTPEPDDAHHSCGLHDLEVFEGKTRYRWSEPVAVIEFELGKGYHILRLHTLVRWLIPNPRMPAFYLNKRLIPADCLERVDDDYFLAVKSRDGGTARLTIVTERQPAPGDPRHLGLPLVKLTSESWLPPRGWPAVRPQSLAAARLEQNFQ